MQSNMAQDQAFAVAMAEGDGRFVLLCDHASNRIPERWGSLGLDPETLQRHIAWDPGALEVAQRMSALLTAPLIHTTISRLVIDCNRPVDAVDAIPEVSEATVIPGNSALDAAERQARIAVSHTPYHRAIDAFLAQRSQPSALVAIHTYTPVYREVARPWPVGIIFNKDRRLADPLIAHLRQAGLNVGVNQPYSPADRVYYTLERHGEANGLPCVMIEIRNDEVTNPDQYEYWAQLLAGGLQAGAAILDDQAAGAA